MSGDLTVGAVRMALDLNKLRAEVASMNIVNTATQGAPVFVVDHSAVDAVLQAAAGENPGSVSQQLTESQVPTLAVVDTRHDVERPTLDVLVADSVSAGLNYQSLTESLGRHFALMRLAISGRSGT
jgi:flagellar basal-body rod protein FlgB